MLWTFLLLLLNFGISWFNAWATGRVWADAKEAGGWPRVCAWAGAIMSASGFTYVYLIVAALIAGSAGYLPPTYVKAALELGYVMIIVPVLGSGMVLWVESVMHAWRTRTFGSVGTAAWNTYAQIHNTYEAATMLPDILKDLGSVFSDSDEDDLKGRLLMLVVLLAVASLAGGILTTCAILKSSARSTALTLREARA